MTALRLALPSEGALYEGTGDFLASCGLGVRRPNARRYTATIPSMPGVEVLFQRQSDITSELDGGSADLGVVGLDRYYESRLENGDTTLVYEDIGFGASQLVLAVPDSWMDVTTVSDLADVALEFREKGRTLRIASKYQRLVKRFLNKRDIYYFSLVPSSGGIEAAPIMGYADMIADVSATGVTLRENQLRPLMDGAVMASQAAIIGNARLLAADEEKLALTRKFLEQVEASLRARQHVRVSANIEGEQKEFTRQLMSKRELSGIGGPSYLSIHNDDPANWFGVQVVVPTHLQMAVVDHLRNLGGSSIIVNGVSYVFRESCESYERLLTALEPYRDGSG